MYSNATSDHRKQLKEAEKPVQSIVLNPPINSYWHMGAHDAYMSLVGKGLKVH